MKPRAIHQILPYLGYGDAIGNLAFELRGVLRAWGYTSEIFAEVCEPRLARECRPLSDYRRFSNAENFLILHYSVGGAANRFVLDVPDRVIVYYHNITPPHFFYAINGDLARRLQEARRDLPLLRERATAIADSPYNQRELEALGFHVLGVTPPILSFAHLPSPSDHHATTDWLFVGRMSPNKCVHDVIRAFHYYHTRLDANAHLWLVGSAEGMSEYVRALERLVARLKLERAVTFAGHVEEVGVYYQKAGVYVSMSEHEGFGIPLVEAMHCGVPVLAFAATSVPETLGDAGVLIQRKDFPVIAELAHEIVTNETLRARIVQCQRARVAAFAPENVCAQLQKCFELVWR